MRTSSALLMIDLDNFKQVNDQYGHMFGDIILSRAAKEIQNLFRANDIIARIGGDMLTLVGQRMNVSQVYIFENAPDNTHCSNTFEWCNSDATSEIQNLQNLSYSDDLPDYEKTKSVAPDAAVGLHCYQCLMGLDEQCADCPARNMEHSNNECLIHNEHLNLHILSAATSIKWDGKDAYLITCREVDSKN